MSRGAEGEAIKSFLAIRGRGSMMSYADIVNKSRARRRELWYGPLSCQAVVGVVDTRRRAAATNPAKSHGPGNAAPAIFFAVPAEAALLMDPVSVEATLSLDVPMSCQGGDAAMLLKGPLKTLQALDNQRHICLSNQPRS